MRRLALEHLWNFCNVLGYTLHLGEPSTTCEGGSYPSVCRGAKTWRERDRKTEKEKQRERDRERKREKERHRETERERTRQREGETQRERSRESEREREKRDKARERETCWRAGKHSRSRAGTWWGPAFEPKSENPKPQAQRVERVPKS